MMSNSEALEVCVKLYMKEISPKLASIPVDALERDVDLTVAPTKLEMGLFLEVVMKVLTKEVLKDEKEELWKYGDHEIVDRYFSNHDVTLQYIEDMYQNDEICEWVMQMFEELLELRNYFIKDKTNSQDISVLTAVERQIPQQVKDIQRPPVWPVWGRCPTCGTVVKKSVNHTCCTECTQRLKWDESK